MTSSATDTRQPASTAAAVQPHTGFLRSIVFYITGLLYNRFVKYGLKYLYSRESEFWAARAPKVVKHYPVRPGLEVRIFYPKRHEQRDANTKLPVFFLFHGGGWTIGNAQMDDEQSHLLAEKYGFFVASIEYGLGPSNRFPAPVEDCSVLMKAVMADPSLAPLNLDLDRVVVGGFSAGAVLSLSLAQRPDWRDLIKALVTFYPLTDFAGENHAEPVVAPWGRVETLPKWLPLFVWSYVPAGQDLRDPRLSPFYATRSEIPQPLFMITAGGDVLHKEAQMTACHLAGIAEDSELFNAESWERGGVRYRRVPVVPHSFTHVFEKIKDPLWEARRLKTNEEVWEEVNEWTKKVLDRAN